MVEKVELFHRFIGRHKAIIFACFCDSNDSLKSTERAFIVVRNFYDFSIKYRFTKSPCVAKFVSHDALHEIQEIGKETYRQSTKRTSMQ